MLDINLLYFPEVKAENRLGDFHWEVLVKLGGFVVGWGKLCLSYLASIEVWYINSSIEL